MKCISEKYGICVRRVEQVTKGVKLKIEQIIILPSSK